MDVDSIDSPNNNINKINILEQNRDYDSEDEENKEDNK